MNNRDSIASIRVTKLGMICLIHLSLAMMSCKVTQQADSGSETAGIGAEIGKALGKSPLPKIPHRTAVELDFFGGLIKKGVTVSHGGTPSSRSIFSAVLTDSIVKIKGIPLSQLSLVLKKFFNSSACAGVSCSRLMGVEPDEVDRFLLDEFLKTATHPASRNPELGEKVATILASLGGSMEERAARWDLRNPQEIAFFRDNIEPFVAKIPEGFAPRRAASDTERAQLEYLNYQRFASVTRERVNELDPDADVLVQGSSVSGYRFPREDDPVDQVKFRDDSDYDIAICSKKMFDVAGAMKVPLSSPKGLRARTAPLKGQVGPSFDSNAALKELGLYDLRLRLEALSGREVSFMIYKTCGGAISGGGYPSIIMPR